MTCFVNENMAICTSGPHERKVYGRTNKKWCFNCRARFVHDKVMYTEILRYTDEGELINGYYEPFIKYECRNCGKEEYQFPGTY